jgi:D-aminopeptidase
VFDWAVRDLPDDALLVVLGDHQPATLITGFEAGPDVPVHFVSGDADLLAELAPAGATSGLVPEASANAAGLQAFRFLLRGR